MGLRLTWSLLASLAVHLLLLLILLFARLPAEDCPPDLDTRVQDGVLTLCEERFPQVTVEPPPLSPPRPEPPATPSTTTPPPEAAPSPAPAPSVASAEPGKR